MQTNRADGLSRIILLCCAVLVSRVVGPPWISGMLGLLLCLSGAQVLSKIMEGVPSPSQLAVAAALQQRLQIEQRKRQQQQQAAHPAPREPLQSEGQAGPSPGIQALGTGRVGRLVVDVARSAGLSPHHQPPLNSPSAAAASSGMQGRGHTPSGPCTPAAGLVGPDGKTFSLTGEVLCGCNFLA
jgi:hypothetical protein